MTAANVPLSSPSSLRHVIRSLFSSLSFAATRLTAAFVRWTSLPASVENASLYTSATVFVAVVTALRVSKSWCFGNGVYLRQRVLLLTHIRAFVLQWEARWLREVAACAADVDGQARPTLSRWIGRAAADTMVRSWENSAGAPGDGTSFYGITASLAFSADLPLEEMLELAYVAKHVLRLREDRLWLQRCIVLLQYVLLRRVSLMQEVRVYAQLHRRVLFPGLSTTKAAHAGLRLRVGSMFGAAAHASPLVAWRLHGRPTWLVPLARADTSTTAAAAEGDVLSSPALVGGSFLCLPLSYFPVESLLPYTAAETWLTDRLVGTVLPMWRAQSIRLLRETARSTSADCSPGGEAGMVATCKVSYWFLHFVEPLLQAQLELHRHAARRFYLAQLSEVAFCESSDGGTTEQVAHCGGSLRLLLKCAHRTFIETLFGGREVASLQHQQRSPNLTSAPVPSSQGNALGRLVRRALLLRAASQAVSVALQVCCPRLSLRHFTEMAAAGYCLQASGASGSVAEVSPVEALLQSLAWQMAWTTAAGVADVFLQRLIGSLGGEVAELLSHRVTAQLQLSLLRVDEAFFQRWLRGASVDPNARGTPSPAPQELRTGSGGSYAVRRAPSAEDVLSVGKRSGEKVLAVHDAAVRRALRVAVLATRTAVTRDWRAVVGAVVAASVDVPQLTAAVSVNVGYSLPADVARLLARRDESLPTGSPAGLRLILEILTEGVLGDNRQRRRGAAVRLRHPYLALVACARVWSFDHLLADTQRSAEALVRHVQALRQVHTAVAHYAYTTRQGGSSNASDSVASMREDARCVAYYALHHFEDTCAARCGAGPVTADGSHHSCTARTLHPLLDTEETQLLQSPAATAYLPEHVDYFDLFSLPYRFILRQLGLEVVFAYRTAAGMQQESRQMAEEWWTQTLFNSAFNPLTCVLQEAMQLLGSCGLVVLLCTRLDAGGRPVLVRTPLLQVFAASHRIDGYRDLLRSGLALRRLEENLCAVQQLCEWLPQHISSEEHVLLRAQDTHRLDGKWESGGGTTASKGVSALQVRRRQWRRVLSACRPELRFDHDDRIVGGLQLRRGVAWHHVYFAYPQLYAGDDGLRPSLSNVTFCCPSLGGMTAVIGPSGAGKSSLNLLLRRLYDPVPVVTVAKEKTSPAGTSASPQCFCHAVDTDEPWEAVLRLALVESTLPPPPSFSPPLSVASLQPISAATTVLGEFGEPPLAVSAEHGWQLQPGFLSLDGIPMCLFSSAYLRQWFAWLPQTPVLFPEQTILQNVRATSPHVTMADVQYALGVCGCHDFVAKKGRALTDRVGALSGGEGQRLALARVVANVQARHRMEVIHGTASAELVGAVGGVVLDEPTSRLDAVNEMRLLDALTALQSRGGSGGTTAGLHVSLPLFMWTISHRMSSLRTATFMVVVEDGKVAMAGPPQEVLCRSAFARQQWQYQQLSAGEAEEEEQGRSASARVDATVHSVSMAASAAGKSQSHNESGDGE